MTAWTYRHAKQIYGGVDLEVNAKELEDIHNPPPHSIVVQVPIRPRSRTMEIQLFDGNHQFLFRLNLAEPLWPVVRDRLQDASLLPQPIEKPCRDQVIHGSKLEALLNALESLLLRYRNRALANGRRGTFGEIATVVLGIKVWLDLRSPQDLELQRLNKLTTAVRKALETAPPLHALVVPKLEVIAFRLAVILRDEVAEIARDDLQKLLRRNLNELRSAAPNEEIRKRRERDVEVASDPSTIDKAVSFLVQWRFIHESPIGVLRATDKLRHMLI